MTICVAWRQKNEANIHLASDSRVSCCGRHSDYCIKVFSAPIRIHDASDSTTGNTPLLFQKDYGFSFAGSSLAMHTIREFLFIQLQRLQVIPHTTESSFVKICEYVCRLASHLIAKLSVDLDADHSIEFFMTGCCPTENTIKIAKFFRNEAEGQFRYTSFDSDFTMQAIGSGKSAFSRRLGNWLNPKWQEVMRVLDEMTQNGHDDLVGGNIQFGNFNKDLNFETRSIMRHRKDGTGMWLPPQCCLAGIDWNDAEFGQRDGDFFVITKCINPFPAK